jgi:LPS-assembly lipoprotein
MLWYEPPAIPASRLQLTARNGVILTSLLLVVAGCGFKPLHATNDSDTSINDQLASISMPQATNRLEQQLRNELLFRLTPRGEPGDPVYNLTLKSYGVLASVVVRRNSSVVRYIYKLHTTFKLFDLKATPKPALLYKGTEVVQLSINKVVSQFANDRAELDGQTRSVRVMADQIRTRLSAWFQRRHLIN